MVQILDFYLYPADLFLLGWMAVALVVLIFVVIAAAVEHIRARRRGRK